VPPRVLTLRELNRATLARQGLLDRWDDTDVPGALTRAAGLQAQEPRPPFVGLWTRIAGLEARDVLAALRAGAAVRATLMRGTLHTVAAEDWALFHGPPEPGDAFLGTRSKGLDVPAVLAAATALLREHGPMSFNALRPMLAERFPHDDARIMGYAARLYLPLVMTPTDDRWGFGRDPVFRLADVALPRKRDNAEIGRRYLAAFGPASAQDVQTWSGLRALRAAVEGMRDELAVFAGEDGRELFDLPGAPRPPADAPGRAVVLLPEFDNLVLAHNERRRVIADEHRPLVATKNLRIKATFLLDGVVAGTWAMTATKTRATVTLEPFARPTCDGRSAAQFGPQGLQRGRERLKPRRELTGEPLALGLAGLAQPVEAAGPAFGVLPLPRDPAVGLERAQQRVHRVGVHGEQPAGQLPDAFHELVAVRRAVPQQVQDEQRQQSGPAQRAGERVRAARAAARGRPRLVERGDVRDGALRVRPL
jgi:hypothetical protein